MGFLSVFGMVHREAHAGTWGQVDVGAHGGHGSVNGQARGVLSKFKRWAAMGLEFDWVSFCAGPLPLRRKHESNEESWPSVGFLFLSSEYFCKETEDAHNLLRWFERGTTFFLGL